MSRPAGHFGVEDWRHRVTAATSRCLVRVPGSAPREGWLLSVSNSGLVQVGFDGSKEQKRFAKSFVEPIRGSNDNG